MTTGALGIPIALLAAARMAQELEAKGVPREKALAAARAEHGISPLVTEEQREADQARREKSIEHDGDKQMLALGFRVIRFSQPRESKQTPGIADRRYVHRARGIALWWECKTATGVQSPTQKDFQEDCEAVGETYIVGTDQVLFDWLVAQGIAARTVGDLLIALPYDHQRRSA